MNDVVFVEGLQHVIYDVWQYIKHFLSLPAALAESEKVVNKDIYIG